MFHHLEGAAFADATPTVPLINIGTDRMSCVKIGMFSAANFTRFMSLRFPACAADQLASICGCTRSTAEKWLRGETRPSGDHLCAMISYFGPAFVAALMPDAHWAQKAVRDERKAQLQAELAELETA